MAPPSRAPEIDEAPEIAGAPEIEPPPVGGASGPNAARTDSTRGGTGTDDTPQAEALLYRDPETLIALLRDDLRDGRPWVEALLDVIAQWDHPAETVDDREYRYLVGGEAFDWLLLAERLLDAVASDRLIPPDEVEALVLHEQFPGPITEEEFRGRLGAAKYRAHLNFVYGVRVEEALQLATEEQIHKERGAIQGLDRRGAPDPFERIYGEPRVALLSAFREAEDLPQVDRLSLTELRDFTYWLFKYRVKTQEPARVASDTRRGLVVLQRMEEWKRRRWQREDSTPAMVIDARAIPVP